MRTYFLWNTFKLTSVELKDIVLADVIFPSGEGLVDREFGFVKKQIHGCRWFTRVFSSRQREQKTEWMDYSSAAILATSYVRDAGKRGGLYRQL